MVALFKDRSPAAVIWLFLLSIVVHFRFFIAGTAVKIFPSNGLLSVFLQKYISGFSLPLLIVLYHLIVMFQALQLNLLFNNHRMFSKNSYLPAMVYILLTGVFNDWSYISSPLLINSLVIWLFAQFVKLYNTPNPKTLLFNIGLLIGASVLLYHPTVLLIPVALLAVLIVRPFSFSELVVMLMGVLFPYYFLAAYLYLTNIPGAIISYLPKLGLNLISFKPTPFLFATIGLVALILFVGLYHWRQENRRLLIQVRKNWIVLLVMLIILLFVPFVNQQAGLESLLLWIVPAAPFMAKGFLGPKKNALPGFMFWVLVAIDIVANWQILK